jgi:hypothetical protein
MMSGAKKRKSRRRAILVTPEFTFSIAALGFAQRRVSRKDAKGVQRAQSQEPVDS